MGGDVEAGLALAELISGMKKPTVSFVLGGGHSIGVPLAVSANRSYIAPSATMTVHPVRTNGLVIGVPRMMNHSARMQSRITDFVVKNSNISESLNSYVQTEYIYDTNFFTRNLETFSCLAFLSDGINIIKPEKLKLIPYFKN